MGDQYPRQVVVIGAGPTGIYAARSLAAAGVKVILLNRDIKPGGLAEYGIYHDKYKMKQGLRKQFRQILDHDNIIYFGNVTVGEDTDLSLSDIRQLGFDSIVVTVGAQGTKRLDLPGEDLRGVYHSKELVYYYNHLPPYSTRKIEIGKRVAVVGAGNVMMDIAHWVIRDLKVDEVIAVVRRGPAEVKFSKAELEIIASNLDLQAFDEEMARVAPVMENLGQDVAAAKEYLLSALPKALPAVSDTRFRFYFLASPLEMISDPSGRVCALDVEENTLIATESGSIKARGLGIKRSIDLDTVIFAIGDTVDARFGLPVNQWNEYVKNPNPSYPVEGISYEVFDPQKNQPIEGVFIAGWSREASTGLVGVARKDGTNGAQAVLQYLENRAPVTQQTDPETNLLELIRKTGASVVTWKQIKKLEDCEQAEADRLGLVEFKFRTNDEMLAMIKN